MKELSKDKGLGFAVDTLPITVYNPESGLYVDSRKYKAIMRTDNGHIYAICTKRKNILQPEVMIDLLVRKFGYAKILESPVIKSDKNATRSAVLINNGNLFSGPKEIESYLTVRNSLDGTRSFGFGITDIGVTDRYSFTRFEYPEFTVRQTSNFDQSVEALFDKLSEFNSNYDEHYANYEKMHNTKASLDYTYQFMYKFFNVDLSIPGIEAKTHKTTMNKAKKGRLRINRALKAHDKSMYGLFQGMCNYTTYDMFKSESNRVTSSFFAHSYIMNNEVYKTILDEIG